MDAFHSTLSWFAATVASVKGDQLEIFYVELGEQYNEWLPRSSKYLARLGTKSGYGTESGLAKYQAQAWKNAKSGGGSAASAGAGGAGPGAGVGVGGPVATPAPSKPKASKSILTYGVRINKGTANERVVTLADMMAGRDLEALPDKVLEAKDLNPEEIQFRDGIEVGNMVDAMDQQGKWYLAEVKQIKSPKGPVDEKKAGGAQQSNDHKSKDPSKDQLFLQFVEWSSTWNIWVSRYSAYIKRANTVSKPRCKQDTLNPGYAERNPTDYSNVDTKRKASCITKQPCPDLIKAGPADRFLRLRMPMDHSCLFHSMSFACEGQLPGNEATAKVQRLRICEIIDANPSFTQSTGHIKSQYQHYIKKMNAWGGGMELSMFSQYFDVDIIAFDIKGPVAHQFVSHSNSTARSAGGDEKQPPLTATAQMDSKSPKKTLKKTKKRIFLVYYGDHYDVLVFLNAKANKIQEFFSADDDVALSMAKQHVELLHLSRFKKKADDTVDWKGQVAMDMPLRAPGLARMASHPGRLQSEEQSATQGAAPVSGAVPIPTPMPPKLSRSKSLGDSPKPVKGSIALATSNASAAAAGPQDGKTPTV